MTLTIFNGSPRKHKSNSTLLTEHFLEGFHSVQERENVRVCYLAETRMLQENLETFKQSEYVIVIFPLYTDCMPGLVKEFFELLPVKDSLATLKLGFVVQSGFPESNHSIYVERYLKKLAQRLNCSYLGTVIKGGVEGIRSMPSSMNKKVFERFYQLGVHFAENGEFSGEIMEKMKNPVKFNGMRLIIFRFLKIAGLVDYYWKSNLKKNGAYHKRNNKPYSNKINRQL